MELNDVLDFIKKNQGLKSLELQDGGFSIKIEWNVGGAPVVAQPVQSVIPQTAESNGEPANVIPGGHDNAKDVLSPLVGTYHDLEGARKVSIGSRLKKGDALCNIEAMKLMNEIVMPEDGEIVWMACAEGDTVEYEQLLFRYE
jgi:acetyl-CoA carboxylase biotin carboxyl carrier protein